jgi:hypothetical protein
MASHRRLIHIGNESKNRSKTFQAISSPFSLAEFDCNEDKGRTPRLVLGKKEALLF